MNRRAYLTGLGAAAIASVAGCLGSADTDDDEIDDGTDTTNADATASAADITLSSIGQTPTDDGTGITVSATVTNLGSETTTVSTTVELLNGPESIADRTISLGDLGPDESASLSLTFDVDPDRVDGRRITFD